ncbi:MAG: beta strand repeat-containing protein [Chthoniobacterales bacterium]
MESLSIANGTSYSIANATTTSTNRTLTLGNSAGFTNVFSGVANDLIFLSGNSNLTIQGPNASTGTGTLSLALANSGNFNVATGSTLTINANISGSVSITKTGGGTAVINPTKTLYTGNTIINGGTLAASTGDYFGPFNSSITINAGTLRYDVTYTGGGNTIVVGSASSAIDTNGSGVSYTPGVISGSGSLTKNGLGTLNLSSVNTFTGGFTANAGLTNLNVNGALGSVTSVTIGTGATVQSPGTGTTNVINDAASVSLSGTGALDVSGGTETVGSLASTSGTPFVVIGDFSGTAGSFTVGDSSSTTFAGVISGSRATAGAIFTKQGSGTLTLSGANTYTGQTVINNGTLSLDNAGSTTPRLVNTTNITVNSGGTLLLASSSGSSTDRINNAATITLAGGTFNLGGRSEGAAGTSGVGALTLTNNSVFDFGTLGTSNLIQFAGLGTHTSSALFQIIDWEGTPGSANGTDRLLFAGTSSAFTSLYNQSDVSFNGEFGYDVMDFGTFYEVFGVAKVPEPSTWASAALALLAVGYSQRRRFSKQSALVKIG